MVETALQHVGLIESPRGTIGNLCAHLNVSRRTLAVAFRGVIGMSPLKYLTQRRLCRAFTSLKQASPDETSVTDVALVHGFHELGRFAGRYQELFGELPRETLRQRPTRSRRMPAGL
jgi:transcriptional regulator GlxA family with amidase domain